MPSRLSRHEQKGIRCDREREVQALLLSGHPLLSWPAVVELPRLGSVQAAHKSIGGGWPDKESGESGLEHETNASMDQRIAAGVTGERKPRDGQERLATSQQNARAAQSAEARRPSATA